MPLQVCPVTPSCFANLKSLQWFRKKGLSGVTNAWTRFQTSETIFAKKMSFTLTDILSRDLLDQHKAIAHSSSSDESNYEGHPPGRKRAAIACQQCAKSKAGCDKKRPCSRCKAKRFPCKPRFARRPKRDHAQQKVRLSHRRTSVTFLIGQTPDATAEADGLADPQDSPEACKLEASELLQTPWSSASGEHINASQQPLLTATTLQGLPLPEGFCGIAPLQSHMTPVEETGASMFHEFFREPPTPTSNYPKAPSFGYLPTPAISPVEASWKGSNDGFDWPAVSQSIPNSLTAMPIPCPSFSSIGHLDDDWPIARCTPRQKVAKSRPLEAIYWLFMKSCQESPWAELDQHVEARLGQAKAVTVVSPEILKAQVGDLVAQNLQNALTGTHYSPCSITADMPMSPTMHGPFPLPSENTVQRLLFTGIKALRCHTGSAYFSNDGRALDQRALCLLPLFLAQGLLMLDHPDAQLFAVALLEMEQQSFLQDLSKLADSLYCETRANLFSTVAAWSGHGFLMQTSALHRGICSAVSKHITVELFLSLPFKIVPKPWFS